MRHPAAPNLALVVVLALAFVLAAFGAAHAAANRPNAIDFRIDRVTNATLLSSPATALVDPERQVAARRLERLMLPGWFASIVVPIVALAYFWQSGLAARLRDRLRRGRGSEAAVRFQFGAGLGLIAAIAALLPEFYIYRIERTMGLSDQLLRAWGSDWLINTLVSMVATGVVVVVVLWLVDRTHQWYLYAIAIIFAVSYVLVFAKPFIISPLLDRFAPLPASAGAVARELETRAKLDVPIAMEIRSRTHLGTAYVEGMGPSKRIVLGDAVLAVSSIPELRYIIAYELGYIGSGAPFRLALLNALCVVFGAAVAVAVADRIGFRRDDDPVSRLALVAALLGVVYLVVLPINNAALRRIERLDAQYALTLTGERAGAVRTIVRGSDQALHNVCPNVLQKLFMERVDDASTRITAINGVPSGCPQ